jgi:Uma2 family endonuclease
MNEWLANLYNGPEMGTKTLFTVEDFEQLSERPGALHELDEGELITMSRPRLQHSLIVGNLFAPLRTVVLEHGLGIVCIEVEFQLAPDTVRVPDIAFIRATRAKSLDPETLIQGAPDLAVEVISPTDLAEDVSRKVHQYLAAGSQAAWVLYPKERCVDIHQPGKPSVTRWTPESLEQPDILPGFSISIADIFRTPHN